MLEIPAMAFLLVLLAAYAAGKRSDVAAGIALLLALGFYFSGPAAPHALASLFGGG